HNDSDDEISAMCDWVVDEVGPDVPIHFSAFHPDFRMLDTPPTPPETLARARSIALESGIHHAYTGNVHDADGDTTWCPACGAAVIVRDWYQIRSHQITDDGRCGACGHVIHGRFDGPPGNWGRRRQPVSIEGRGS
ncbi:MAG: hypothetical protein KDB16_11725, partial [Acidimicrobiales bacterium]|nr:hypothetical protein [Acidimicrobiales bacterium]